MSKLEAKPSAAPKSNATHSGTNVVPMPSQEFRPSSQHPIRRDRLHPGSFFRIVKEPSRGIGYVNDGRVYRASYNGFYAEETITKRGCILMPSDLVMPVVRVKQGK